MAVNSIVEILRIKTEDDLLHEIGELETKVSTDFKPLSDKLKQQVLTCEVQQLEMHMTFVESWRDRAAKALMLSTVLEQHAKSQRFLIPYSKNVTTIQRESHLRGLASGASGLVVYFEQLLRTIDSRVNLCKKLLGNEETGTSNKRFV